MRHTSRRMSLWLTLILLIACTPRSPGQELPAPSTTTESINIQAFTDCSRLLSYGPTSPEGRALAEDLVASYLKEWPTEYMGLDQLWHVDQADNFVIVQGLVTQEEADVLVAARTADGMHATVRVTSHSGIRTREDLVKEIARQDPTVPAAMLECVDFRTFLAAAP